MTLKIESVKCYRCPKCKTIHKIAPLAASCLKRCIKEDKRRAREKKKEAEQSIARNSLRLEASSLTEAINLLVSKSKELYNLDIRLDSWPIRFGIQNVMHSCPIGKRTNWGSDPELPRGHLGWYGQWKGTIKGTWKGSFGRDKANWSDYCDRWSNGFAGFHTGTGCGGDEFDISGVIFMEDFPKIYKRQIPYYTGNFLCCTVNRWRKCNFCGMSWCDEHAAYLKELSPLPQCPFDGYTLVR